MRKVSPEGLVYSTDLSMYQALCVACHIMEDHHVGSRPGELNGQAKLTENDVRQIRRLYADGWGSQAVLAREFSITQSNVAMIVRRKTWQHVL